MNEIFPTIYEQVPTYVQEEFSNCPANILRILTQEEEKKIPVTDKWYINYN